MMIPMLAAASAPIPYRYFQRKMEQGMNGLGDIQVHLSRFYFLGYSDHTEEIQNHIYRIEQREGSDKEQHLWLVPSADGICLRINGLKHQNLNRNREPSTKNTLKKETGTPCFATASF